MGRAEREAFCLYNPALAKIEVFFFLKYLIMNLLVPITVCLAFCKHIRLDCLYTLKRGFIIHNADIINHLKGCSILCPEFLREYRSAGAPVHILILNDSNYQDVAKFFCMFKMLYYTGVDEIKDPVALHDSPAFMPYDLSLPNHIIKGKDLAF